MRALTSIALLSTTVILFSSCGRSGAETEPPEVVVAVKVAPLQRGVVTEKLIAYGSVIAAPGKSETVSVPYETVVIRTLVAPGQSITQGDPIAEIKPSPQASLQLQQAQSAAQTALKDLAQTRQRFSLRLATNQELNAAAKAADEAGLQLHALQAQGIDAPIRTLTAPSAGTVGTLGVQPGQTVAPGTSLAEIIPASAIEVRLGLEPEDVDALKKGNSVVLTAINQPDVKAIEGTVRLVTKSINPASGLVDAFVTLPADSGLFPNGSIRAEFGRKSPESFVVSPAALITTPEETRIFTVENGQAVARLVTTGIRSDEAAEIHGDGLTKDAQVVVEGNTELENGMKVEAQPWK